jgi:hypothetical protein
MDSRAARRRGVSRIATIAISVLAGGALALAASLALVPGKAEAHFPYEHAAANMPSWFAESPESCSPVEQFSGNASALEWECFKHVGHPWPDRGLYCNATVDHSEPSGGYSGGWFCYVGDDRTPFPGYCLRRYEYFAYENGQIAESYDPGGWYIASRSDYVFFL